MPRHCIKYRKTFSTRYTDLIAALVARDPLGQLIIDEEEQKRFIRLCGAILRLQNIFAAFDGFAGNEIVPDRDFQDYQSIYIGLYQGFTKGKDADKENINDDIVFEMELIKQIEVNIDYILMLVAKFHQSNCTDWEILAAIIEAEGLKPDEARQFMDNAFRDGILKTTGTDLDKILPPMPRFSVDGGRVVKTQGVI